MLSGYSWTIGQSNPSSIFLKMMETKVPSSSNNLGIHGSKVHIVRTMVFPVVMYRYEHWTIKKKAEHQRIDAFELWCWRRLLRVPWSVRKSTLNILWKDWCWRSNTSVTWCEEPTHWKRPWFWERLRAGGEEGDRGWDGWLASLTQWHEFEQALGDSEGQGSLACCRP